MDPIVLTIIGVSITLTILLVVIGIQVALILKEFRLSVQKTNKMLDDAGKVTETVSTGVVNMSGFMNGIRTGVSMITSLRHKGNTMSEDHGGGGDFKFLLGLFLGGIIGAVIIFFLGTREGKKVGRELKEKGEGILDDLGDQIADLEKKGQDLVNKGEEVKEQIMETVVEKKEEMTQTATEKLDTALAHIEELQAQGQQTTAELRKRIFRNLPKKR